MPVLRLSRFGYPLTWPTCHQLQAHLLARLHSPCNVDPLPLHTSKSFPNPCPQVLNTSTQCVSFSSALQGYNDGKKGHLFSGTSIYSDYFWLKSTDLSRDCFFYRLRWSISGQMLIWVASGQWSALLCRRMVFVLSHIRGSDQPRELCREQGCPAGCCSSKAIGQNCGNTVSIPQPGGNKWASLTPVCKI